MKIEQAAYKNILAIFFYSQMKIEYWYLRKTDIATNSGNMQQGTINDWDKHKKKISI